MEGSISRQSESFDELELHQSSDSRVENNRKFTVGGIIANPGYEDTQLTCCGSAVCSWCCIGCRLVRRSVLIRLMYFGMMILSVVVACIMLVPDVQNKLVESDWFCKGLSETTGIKCNRAIGFRAVYRLCAAMATYFVVLMLFTYRVRRPYCFGYKIQNGFCLIKCLIFVGITTGFFFIRAESMSAPLMWVGFIGASVFTILQPVFIVIYTKRVTERWLDNYEKTKSRACYAGLLSFTLLCYGTAITAAGLMFYSYATGGTCYLSKTFILLNLISCFFVSFVSLLPSKTRKPGLGLLPTSFITLYIMYITWSALINNPDKVCNPSLINVFTNSSSVEKVYGTPVLAEPFVSLFLLLVYILYIIFRSHNAAADESLKNELGYRIWNDEKKSFAYTYFYFHLFFGLASLYVMMILTSWYKPGNDLSTLNGNMAAVWVKIVSSWVCIVSQTWSAAHYAFYLAFEEWCEHNLMLAK